MKLTAIATIAATSCLALPAAAQDEATFAPVIGSSLTEKVWVQSEEDTGLPGSMMLFLSDGTMMQTSCWEGYRLSNWQMTGEDSLSWQEDTMSIDVDIVELNEAELVLALHLVDDVVERRFTVSPVPYVCPDMPR